MIGDEPPVVSVLRGYLERSARGAPNQLKSPFLLIGPSGVGKHYHVRNVLASKGFVPVWTDGLEEVAPIDLDGNRLFPVYVWPKWKDVPPHERSIILLPSLEGVPPEVRKESQSFEIPLPGPASKMKFLIDRGVPKETWEQIAEGNPTYSALLRAIEIWKASGVVTHQEVPSHLAWEAFLEGKDPPFDGPLLAYYHAYNSNTTIGNRALFLSMQRGLSRGVREHLLDVVRLTWKGGNAPRFPEALKKREAWTPGSSATQHSYPRSGSVPLGDDLAEPSTDPVLSGSAVADPSERYATEW